MKMKHKLLSLLGTLAMTAVLFSCNHEPVEQTPESTPEQVSFKEIKVNDHWHYSLYNECTNVITVNSATEDSIKFTINSDTNPENLEHMLQVVFDGQYEAEKVYKCSYKIKGPSENDESEMNVCCWVTKKQANSISHYNSESFTSGGFIVRCDTTESGGLLFFPTEAGEYTISDVSVSSSNSNAPKVTVIEDAEYNGIRLRLENTAENAKYRRIYMNGTQVSDEGEEHVFDSVWNYPFVKAGGVYKIYVIYLDENWATIQISETMEITASSGKGDWHFENTEYEIVNNVLKFKNPPELKGVFDDEFPAYTLIPIRRGWLCSSEIDEETGKTVYRAIGTGEIIPTDENAIFATRELVESDDGTFKEVFRDIETREIIVPPDEGEYTIVAEDSGNIYYIQKQYYNYEDTYKNYHYHYAIEIENAEDTYRYGGYQSWNRIGDTYNNNFNFAEHVNEDVDSSTPLQFTMWLEYTLGADDEQNTTGEYIHHRFVMLEYKDNQFHLE